MHSNKCRHCGLVNAVADIGCRRCGHLLEPTERSIAAKAREAPKWSSPLYMLLAVTLIGGAVYYVYNGFENAFDQVKANEANRLAAQAKPSPPSLSRSDYDQQRAEPYKNAVANSPGLATSKQHTDEVDRLMQSSKPAR